MVGLNVPIMAEIAIRIMNVNIANVREICVWQKMMIISIERMMKMSKEYYSEISKVNEEYIAAVEMLLKTSYHDANTFCQSRPRGYDLIMTLRNVVKTLLEHIKPVPWKEIKDELPPEGVSVLLCGTSNYMAVGRLRYFDDIERLAVDKPYLIVGERSYSLDSQKTGYYRYWMPLPKRPEAEL